MSRPAGEQLSRVHHSIESITNTHCPALDHETMHECNARFAGNREVRCENAGHD
jgi:hypothetical protein